VFGQILRVPITCHYDHYPPELNLTSMTSNAHSPILSKRSMEIFYDLYNPSDVTDPSVSPLLSKDFKNLPPAYIQVCGKDPLRDEGLAYADKLEQAG
jgi:acetyl esterase/lipase